MPELYEQKKIAAILDNVSKLLFLRKQQLAKLDELVKTRFVEMFGDPVTNNFGWMMQVLGDNLEIQGGYAFRSEGFKIAGIPVLRIGNINSGHFLPVNMVFWQNDSTLNRYKVYPGDLVISLTGTVGKNDYGNVCILGNEYPQYYLNQRNAKLILKPPLNKYYLSELLKFDKIKSQLTGISRGIRQSNISNKDILSLSVPIPPIETQNEYSAFRVKTNRYTLTIQRSLDRLETLKRALMQKYFG